MFAFAGLILIYAGILYLTKDSTMIMRDYAVKIYYPMKKEGI